MQGDTKDSRRHWGDTKDTRVTRDTGDTRGHKGQGDTGDKQTQDRGHKWTQGTQGTQGTLEKEGPVSKIWSVYVIVKKMFGSKIRTLFFLLII